MQVLRIDVVDQALEDLGAFSLQKQTMEKLMQRMLGGQKENLLSSNAMRHA